MDQYQERYVRKVTPPREGTSGASPACVPASSAGGLSTPASQAGVYKAVSYRIDPCDQPVGGWVAAVAAAFAVDGLVGVPSVIAGTMPFTRLVLSLTEASN